MAVNGALVRRLAAAGFSKRARQVRNGGTAAQATANLAVDQAVSMGPMATRLENASLLARARAIRAGTGPLPLVARLGGAGALGRARGARGTAPTGGPAGAPFPLVQRLTGAGVLLRARAARGPQGAGGASIFRVPRPADAQGVPKRAALSAVTSKLGDARRNLYLARLRRRLPGGGF